MLPVRVYWEDTDAGGIVFHANYVRFFERGRTDLLRLLGVDQSAVQAESGWVFAIRKMTLTFERPAKLDDLLEIETRISAIGGASLTLDQVARRGEDVLVSMRVVVVAVRDGKAMRIPSDVRERLASVISSPPAA